MALTADEQNKIIFFLGWPGKTLVSGSTHYNTTVVNRMTNLDAPSETRTRTLITSIEAVRTKYEASTSRALVKKVGDIELNTDEHTSLSKEYKRQLRDLSALLDIPLQSRGGVNIGVRC